MKCLIVYYSRTGVTKTIGKELAKQLKCDYEEISDKIKRGSPIGYIKCGREAMARKMPKLNPLKKNPANYDLVIIGTPIWGWNMCSLIRSYITKKKDSFKNVAFFCTQGGSGANKAFKEMQEIIGKKPKAEMILLTKEVVKNDYANKVKEFVKKIIKIVK